MLTVTFGDVSEENGKEAYSNCELMERIVISNIVKAIMERALYVCLFLMRGTLGDDTGFFGSKIK